MTSSLVGSEMCIRDREVVEYEVCSPFELEQSCLELSDCGLVLVRIVKPVSYTHLTLPTICSV
eukprot:3087446-Prorocentrum_lima.AAC.1